MTEKTAKERVMENRPYAFVGTSRYAVYDWPERWDHDNETPRPLSGVYATEELAWQAAAAYLGCN